MKTRSTDSLLFEELFEKMQKIDEAFRESVTETIVKIEDKVDKKNLPINLEKDILKTAQESISESIKIVLTAYNSPLIKLITSVIDEHSVFLRKIISDSFNEVIQLKEFKESIVSAFSHKIARSIISNNNGLFDKVNNELKQSAEFKSKMVLAVARVVEECLQEK